MECFEKLERCGVVPVLTVPLAKSAPALGEALLGGGLYCAEVTFRTSAAADVIRTLAARYAGQGLLVGAGTVLSAEQADLAMEAGAAFLISPGLNPAVVRHCLQHGYPILPGVCTPSEAEAGMALGLTHLKFFPAGAAGGAAMLRALAAPYSRLRFMPTGGITPENLGDYLACPNVFACGGSWIASESMIQAGEWSEIRRRAAEASAWVTAFRAARREKK